LAGNPATACRTLCFDLLFPPKLAFHCHAENVILDYYDFQFLLTTASRTLFVPRIHNFSLAGNNLQKIERVLVGDSFIQFSQERTG